MRMREGAVRERGGGRARAKEREEGGGGGGGRADRQTDGRIETRTEADTECRKRLPAKLFISFFLIR